MSTLAFQDVGHANDYVASLVARGAHTLILHQDHPHIRNRLPWLSWVDHAGAAGAVPLHEFVALVTHLAELDDQARQLGLVNWAIKDTAITRIVDLAVSGGLLAKDVPTFAVWVQSAVRFRAEADAATLAALGTI